MELCAGWHGVHRAPHGCGLSNAVGRTDGCTFCRLDTRCYYCGRRMYPLAISDGRGMYEMRRGGWPKRPTPLRCGDKYSAVCSCCGHIERFVVPANMLDRSPALNLSGEVDLVSGTPPNVAAPNVSAMIAWRHDLR